MIFQWDISMVLSQVSRIVEQASQKANTYEVIIASFSCHLLKNI